MRRNFFAKWREISWNVIAIARIMHMRADELGEENIFAAVFEEKPELLKHEADVAASVRALLAAQLSRYATSISQDELLLATPHPPSPVSYRRRCAIQLRLDQKRLLISCQDALSPS